MIHKYMATKRHHKYVLAPHIAGKTCPEDAMEFLWQEFAMGCELRVLHAVYLPDEALLSVLVQLLCIGQQKSAGGKA